MVKSTLHMSSLCVQRKTGAAHQRNLLQESSGGEQDEAVDVVGPAHAAALHRVDEQRGAAQGVRDHAQAVRLRDPRQVVYVIPLLVLPRPPPADTQLSFSLCIWSTTLGSSTPHAAGQQATCSIASTW